jgi:hypothetical protein
MLVVGGYDKARIDPESEFTRFPVGQWSLEYACPLQVTITNLTFADQPLMNASQEIHACIEPSAQRFFLPPGVAHSFAEITGQNSTLYPEGMHYNVSNRPVGDLRIQLSNGYESTIPNDELFAPLRGSDKNGRYAIVNDTVLEAFIGDTREENPDEVKNTIGAIFLTFNYLMVDYEKGEFNLAKAVTAGTDEVPPDPSTVCTPAGGSPTPSSAAIPSPKSSNTGAIAGGVVGGVLGLAVLVLVGFVLYKRMRRRREEKGKAGAGHQAAMMQRQPSELAGTNEPIHELATSRQASMRKPRAEMDNSGAVYT